MSQLVAHDALTHNSINEWEGKEEEECSVCQVRHSGADSMEVFNQPYTQLCFSFVGVYGVCVCVCVCVCMCVWFVYTVEHPITDPPTSGQPLYNGHWLWHQLKLP